MTALAREIRSRSPGDGVTLTVVRDGDETRIEVSLGRRG
jgi:S1-C subfamily serine protease